jgi:hypothetical protein
VPLNLSLTRGLKGGCLTRAGQLHPPETTLQHFYYRYLGHSVVKPAVVQVPVLDQTMPDTVDASNKKDPIATPYFTRIRLMLN